MNILEKLKNVGNIDTFAKTVQGVTAVGSSTKKVVYAAADGKLKDFTAAVKRYNFKHARDYSMILLVFAPIVAGVTALLDGNEDKELGTLVDGVLTSNKFAKLCEYIGEGNGAEIKKTLDSFQKYKKLFVRLVDQGSYDKLLTRNAEIRGWSLINKNRIKKKIIPFIRDSLNSRFASKFTLGVSNSQQPVKSAEGKSPSSRGQRRIVISTALRDAFRDIGLVLDTGATSVTQQYVLQQLNIKADAYCNAFFKVSMDTICRLCACKKVDGSGGVSFVAKSDEEVKNEKKAERKVWSCGYTQTPEDYIKRNSGKYPLKVGISIFKPNAAFSDDNSYVRIKLQMTSKEGTIGADLEARPDTRAFVDTLEKLGVRKKSLAGRFLSKKQVRELGISDPNWYNVVYRLDDKNAISAVQDLQKDVVNIARSDNQLPNAYVFTEFPNG